MCPPEHFDVVYVINPWMDPSTARRRGRAPSRNGRRCGPRTKRAGHPVDTIDSQAGLPDMVFAANSALVVDGTAVLARFRYPQRTGEERAVRALVPRPRLRRCGAPSTCTKAKATSRVAGDVILGGYGFRTDLAAHREVEAIFGARGRDASNSSTRASTTSTPRCSCSTTSRSRTTPARSRPRADAELAAALSRRDDRDRSRRDRRSAATPTSDGHARVPAGGRRRAGDAISKRAASPSIPTRSARAAQGRRQREVLHARTASPNGGAS